MKSLFFLSIFLSLIFASTTVGVPVSHAQILGDSTLTSIELSSSYPQPGEQITASLNVYAVDTAGASISWSLDGVRLPEFENARRISFVAGPLGRSQVVRSVITLPSGTPLALSAKVVPTIVDVIVEANTFVPAFYRGRALPSAESRLRATAIVHVGASADFRELSYDWLYNDVSLLGGPVKGKQSVNFTATPFSSAPLVVEVYDAQGVKIGRRRMSLQFEEPLLRFYEINPLRGMDERAVGDSFVLTGSESTVYAAPYYLNTSVQSPLYRWQVEGEEVSLDDPTSITLRKVGSSPGEALVELTAVSSNAFTQFVSGAFRVFFR